MVHFQQGKHVIRKDGQIASALIPQTQDAQSSPEMEEEMNVEIKIDSSCQDMKVVIYTDRITDEINMLVQKISEEYPSVLSGFRGERLAVLEHGDIIRIYAAAGKVFAVTDNGEFTLRLRLYELEERLDKRQFVRISNSEIINLKKVKGFDLSFTGTICVSFPDNTVTYVSRRYVTKIKRILGL